MLGSFLPIITSDRGVYQSISNIGGVYEFLYILPLIVGLFGILELYGKRFQYFDAWVIVLSVIGVVLPLLAYSSSKTSLTYFINIQDSVNAGFGSAQPASHVTLSMGSGVIVQLLAYLAIAVFSYSKLKKQKSNDLA